MLEVLEMVDFVNAVKFVKSDDGSGTVTYYSAGESLPSLPYSKGGTFTVEARSDLVGTAAATVTYSVPANNGVLRIDDESTGVVTILKAGASVAITAHSVNTLNPNDIDEVEVYITIDRKSLEAGDITYLSIEATVGGLAIKSSPTEKPIDEAQIGYFDVSLPSGLTVDSTTGEIAGTPGQGATIGTQGYTIRARVIDTQTTEDDYYQGSVDITVSITINRGTLTSAEFLNGSTTITQIDKTYLDVDFTLQAQTTPTVNDTKFTFSVNTGGSVTLSEDTTTADFINDKVIIASAGDTGITVSAEAPGYEAITATLTIKVAKKALPSNA